MHTDVAPMVVASSGSHKVVGQSTEEKRAMFVTRKILVAIALAGAIVNPAFAECPEGKIEITIITPNGNVKTHCIAEAANDWIENAGDPSGTVVAATCPCFTLEEVELTLINTPDWYCQQTPGLTSNSLEPCAWTQCFEGDWFDLFEAMEGPSKAQPATVGGCSFGAFGGPLIISIENNYCWNELTEKGLSLTEVEAVACVAILNQHSVLDSDRDGWPDTEDNCPFHWNLGQADEDNDTTGDICDSCLGDPDDNC